MGLNGIGGWFVAFRRQRHGTGWRRPFAGPDVSSPAAFVFGRSELLELRFAAPNSLLVELLQKRNAPAAACSGAAAFGKLAGTLVTTQANEIHQLALRHVEAVTNFRIPLHHHLAGVVLAHRSRTYVSYRSVFASE